MDSIMILVFAIGYIAIVLEQLLKINKAAISLLMAALLWIVHTLTMPETAQEQLLVQLADTCSVVLYLLGAMIIVELVDSHGGFALVPHLIKAKRRRALLITISAITFFLSMILDNMTTTIIMIAIMFKLIHDYETRLWFVSIIILAANAGGACSPIGDVMTIMLWVKGNITADALIPHLFLPCIVSVIVPLLLIIKKMNGTESESSRERLPETKSPHSSSVTVTDRILISLIGMGGLVFVPVFRTLTGLPPFMGIMLVLGILWVTTEIIYDRKRDIQENRKLRISKVISRIDLTTVMFFLGILMVVGALKEQGILAASSAFLDKYISNEYLTTGIIGILSSIIDNVPLVAAAMGMYPVADPLTVEAGTYAASFVQNGSFWELLAFCAGTGGSLLIIGSAAGIVSMGLTNINFGWYLKNITWRAFLGYIAGMLIYWLTM